MSLTITHSRAKEFREQLQNRVLVADGAMGTMLYSKGIFINRCYDELNLSAPQMVREIHEAYVKAGAEILETNTFGATRPRLAAFGLIVRSTSPESESLAKPRGIRRLSQEPSVH
jgi:methionine synthase / methylenetetrahydrofolate reductase(NADPH)